MRILQYKLGFIFLLMVVMIAEYSYGYASPHLLEVIDKTASMKGNIFVSIKSKDANMRSGPGMRYPLRAVYHCSGYPVLILDEFEYWRKIRDSSGNEGWMQSALLSNIRTALTIVPWSLLMQLPHENARPLARIEKDVIVNLKECKGEWCEVSVRSYGLFNKCKGWLKRQDLWGVE